MVCYIEICTTLFRYDLDCFINMGVYQIYKYIMFNSYPYDKQPTYHIFRFHTSFVVSFAGFTFFLQWRLWLVKRGGKVV